MWDFISWIIIGVAAGWLAGVVTGTNRNIVGDLILGLVGAVIAGFFVDSVSSDNLILSIIVAAIFAAILVVIRNAVMKNR